MAVESAAPDSITIGFSVLGTLFTIVQGAFMFLYREHRNLEKNFTAYREYIAANFTPKSELKEQFVHLERKIDKGFEKIYDVIRDEGRKKFPCTQTD